MARRREQLHQSPSNNKTTIQRETTAPIFTSLQIKINQVISKMKNTRVALCFSLAFLFYVVEGAKVTFTNRCEYTVWPGTLTGDQKPQLSTTGFELGPGATTLVDLPSPWSGRFWGRTGCSDNNGKFSCATADCASGQVGCNGAGAIPPATLVEITVASLSLAYSYAYDDKSSTFT